MGVNGRHGRLKGGIHQDRGLPERVEMRDDPESTIDRIRRLAREMPENRAVQDALTLAEEVERLTSFNAELMGLLREAILEDWADGRWVDRVAASMERNL